MGISVLLFLCISKNSLRENNVAFVVTKQADFFQKIKNKKTIKIIQNLRKI